MGAELSGRTPAGTSSRRTVRTVRSFDGGSGGGGFAPSVVEEPKNQNRKPEEMKTVSTPPSNERP